MHSKKIENNEGPVAVVDSPSSRGQTDFSGVERFIRKAIERYVEFNIRYRKAVGIKEYPFLWGEIQNHPALFLAMSKSFTESDTLLAECTFKHNHREDEPESRRLDYWVLLGCIDTVLLIEYKHRKIYLKQNRHREGVSSFKDLERLSRPWRDDVDKLKKLKEPRNLADLSSWDGKKRSVVKVALMMLPICQDSKVRERVNPIGLTDFISLMDEIKLKPEPNWKAYWYRYKKFQTDDLADSEKYDDGKSHWSSYPGVYFFAWLK
jgi:hypothetical protein